MGRKRGGGERVFWKGVSEIPGKVVAEKGSPAGKETHTFNENVQRTSPGQEDTRVLPRDWSEESMAIIIEREKKKIGRFTTWRKGEIGSRREKKEGM